MYRICELHFWRPQNVLWVLKKPCPSIPLPSAFGVAGAKWNPRKALTRNETDTLKNNLDFIPCVVVNLMRALLFNSRLRKSIALRQATTSNLKGLYENEHFNGKSIHLKSFFRAKYHKWKLLVILAHTCKSLVTFVVVCSLLGFFQSMRNGWAQCITCLWVDAAQPHWIRLSIRNSKWVS